MVWNKINSLGNLSDILKELNILGKALIVNSIELSNDYLITVVYDGDINYLGNVVIKYGGTKVKAIKCYYELELDNNTVTFELLKDAYVYTKGIKEYKSNLNSIDSYLEACVLNINKNCIDTKDKVTVRTLDNYVDLNVDLSYSDYDFELLVLLEVLDCKKQITKRLSDYLLGLIDKYKDKLTDILYMTDANSLAELVNIIKERTL